MTKKKTMKNIKTPNKFWDGGAFTENFKAGFGEAMGLPGGGGFKDMFSAANMGKALGAAVPGMAGALGGVAGELISNGFSTTGGQVLSGVGDAAMAFNPLIGGAIKAASGIINRGFGTKWDEKNLAKANANINSLNKFSSGATDYDSLMWDINKMNQFNANIKASDLGKDGWFVNRTTNKANELNTDLGNAYNYAMRNVNNVADNIAGNTLANLERNYAAFGGPLFAYGGQTHGSDFTNGLMFINNGGTHESNPYEGVPISMDQEGNPNLVEEGEVIWNDYVFSNRLKVPKSVQQKYKLGKNEITFADAVNRLSKESEERPNDPISIKSLEKILEHMAIEQEAIKNNEQNKKINSNKFAVGGPTSGMSWFQDSNGNYYQEYLDAVNNLTKQQYIDYKKRITGKDVNYTDQEFERVKQGMIDGVYGDSHIDMYNIMQAQPLDVSTQDIFSTFTPKTPEVKLVDTWTPTDRRPIPNIDPDGNSNMAWLRFAPAVGSLFNMVSAFKQRPDYSNAAAIENAAYAIPTVNVSPLGDYVRYNPFDTEYQVNQLRAISGTTRRNIMNTSGGNRAAATAGILAADNNTMNQLGDLYRKAAEYNLEQKYKVADFNRNTNQINRDISYKNQLSNIDRSKAILGATTTGAQMREQIDSNLGKVRSQAISGLFTNLGNIGIDAANRRDTKALINSDVFGTLNEYMRSIYG